MNNICICEICYHVAGAKAALSRHIKVKHNLSPKEYFDKFIEPIEHKCPFCDNEKKFINLVKGYIQTCGTQECRNSNNAKVQSSKEVQEKTKQTKLERYGDENFHNVERARQTKLERYGDETYNNIEKAKQTNQDKYGKCYYTQTEGFKEKSKQTKLERYGDEKYSNIEKIQLTCLAKYGVENISQTKETKDKKKQTCLEMYGCENQSQAKEVQEKIQQTCLAKYGVTRPLKSKEVREKAKQTCLAKYGVEYPSQSKDIREKAKQTWIETIGVDHPSKSKEIAKRRVKKYEYSGLSFDSRAEVEVYRFCKENDIQVKYQPCSFTYIDSLGNEHIYFPDFEINGHLYEVKGDHLWKDGHIWFPYRNTLNEEQLSKIDARDLAKTECMKRNNVTVILTSELETFMSNS